MSYKKNILLWLLLLTLTLLLGACTGPRLENRRGPVAGQDEALASIYLATTGSCPGAVSFTVDEIALLNGGLWLPLDISPVRVESAQVKDRQQLLGLAVVSAGSYTQIRFRLTDIKVGSGKESTEVSDQEVKLPFPKTVSLDEGNSTCLFLDWRLTDCLGEGDRFIPRFSARGQGEPLAGELAYVVCDDIDTLYLVRTDTNFVVASLGLAGRLGELRFDEERRRLYVAGSGARAIYVLDATNNRLIDRIALPLTLEPRFMVLSPDGAFAFVTDAPTNRVMKIDLQDGDLERQATVGYRPERVIYFEDGGGGRLAISSSASQQVYLLNAEDLGIVSTIPAGFEPDGLLFLDGLLYIAERGSRTVTAYDLQEGRLAGHIAVGLKPTFLLADDGRKIYVSNYGGDSLSVLIPGQHTAFREITIGPGPSAMLLSQRRQAVYVANRSGKTLSVMDLAAERVKAVVPLGGTPFSLVIWE